MRYKSTIVLFVAVAVCAAVAYSLSRRPTSEEISRERKRLLAGFEPSAVESLVLEEPGKRIVCRREGKDQWRITEPVNTYASRWALDEMLNNLQVADKVSAVYPEKGEPLDLKQYGLDQPVRTVTIASAGPNVRTWTVLVGEEAGVKENVFVAVGGEDAVFAVNASAVAKTATNVQDLRSKNLAPRLTTMEVDRIAVSARALDDKPAFDLECASKQATWELKKPIEDAADSVRIRQLIDRLYGYSIDPGKFAADDATRAAQFGLDEPDLTWTVEAGGRTHTFLFARQQEGDRSRWYAMLKGEQTIAEVDESLPVELRKPYSELRKTDLAEFTTPDVSKLVLAAPEGELIVERKGGEWEIAGEKPVPADGDAVVRLLRALNDAKVDEFVSDSAEDLSPYGLAEKERRTLTLHNDAGTELVRLFLGGQDKAGQLIYVMRGAYVPVLATKRQDYVDTLLKGRLALLNRMVLDEPSADAVELVLEREGERFRCVWDEQAGQWGLAEPIEGQADPWGVQSVLGVFSLLQAESFVAEKAEDLAPYGLDKPRIVATVSYGRAGAAEGGEAPERRARTLQIGAPVKTEEEGSYARLADDPRVFVLPYHEVHRFRDTLASKQVCTAPDLVGMTLQRGETTLKFSYDAGKDQWSDAGGQPVPIGMLDIVKDAARVVQNFRGVRVADYSEKSPALYGFDAPLLTVVVDEKTTQGKVIVIGKEAEGGRYARGPATSFVHVADPGDVAKLTAVFEPPKPAAGPGAAQSEGGLELDSEGVEEEAGQGLPLEPVPAGQAPGGDRTEPEREKESDDAQPEQAE